LFLVGFKSKYSFYQNIWQVRTNDEKPAGKFEVEYNGSALTSGLYFYKLNLNNLIETKKMVLLK